MSKEPKIEQEGLDRLDDMAFPDNDPTGWIKEVAVRARRKKRKKEAIDADKAIEAELAKGEVEC